MNESDRNDELSDREAAAFRDLPRERIPPAHLEDRVVAAARAEGLLAAPGGRRSGPRRVRWHGPWAAAAVAAGLALFASGVAVGQWMTGRGVIDVVGSALGQPQLGAAAQVQEAGSEYVRAVAHLAELADRGDRADVASGSEAARVALHAAALELARVSPDDHTLQLVLAVLEERMQSAADSTGTSARRTIWF